MPRGNGKRARGAGRPAGRPKRAVRATTALVPLQQVPMARSPRRRRTRVTGRASVSSAGINFLKCAFAPADFVNDQSTGIPDGSKTKLVQVKDYQSWETSFVGKAKNNAGTNVDAARDYYLLFAPVPGVSCFEVSGGEGIAAGSDPSVLTANFYPTHEENFGSCAEKCKFSRFRFGGKAFGVYPTNNYMNFSGSISAWRVPLSLGLTNNTFVPKLIADASGKVVDISATNAALATAVGVRLTGAHITHKAPRGSYADSWIRGVYGVCPDRSGKFEWNDMYFSSLYTTGYDSTLAISTPKFSLQAVAGNIPDPKSKLTGLGNLESTIVKISVPAGQSLHAIIKTWDCLEAEPRIDSVLYSLAHFSPPQDERVMQAYHALRERLPVAVPCAQNGEMWDKISAMLSTWLKLGSNVPGGAGLVAGGLHQALEGMRLLTI